MGLKEKRTGFKQNDYIVLIKPPLSIKGNLSFTMFFKKNHIYKIKTDSSIIFTCLDSKGGKNNGWSCYDFNYDNWRYATEEEILLYNYHGKPVKVQISIDNYSII